MKKILLITTFLFPLSSFLVMTSVSSAATYPASCPKEAQGIVEVVGGCSAINKNQYPSVYNKCCAVTSTTPAPTVTPRPTIAPTPTITPTPTVITKPTPVKPPAPYVPPKPLKPIKLQPVKYPWPFDYFSDSDTTAPATTSVQELPSPAQPEDKPLRFLGEGLKSFFDLVSRLFR